MQYPFKVNNKDYKKLTENENLSFLVLEDCDVYYALDDRLLEIETNLTVVTVWEEVRKTVEKKDYEFLLKRFRDRVKYRDLAEELGVTVTSLKARQRRLLFKLKSNMRLKQIAKDCFEI